MAFWLILIVYVSSKHLSDWIVGGTYFCMLGGFGENFFPRVLFFFSYICPSAVHTKKIFSQRSGIFKKRNRQIGSNSSIFEDFTIKFTINSGSWDTPSFFSRSKILIFPCFFDIFSQISHEILGKKVWYFDECWSSMYPLNPYRFGLLVAHTFLCWEDLEKNFFPPVLFFLSYIAAPAVHTKNFFFFKDVAIKKK